MLILFETPAGFALFQLNDKKAFESIENIEKAFKSPESSQKVVSLKSFHRFENSLEGVQNLSSIVEGKVSKDLKKLLKKEVDKKEELAVCDKNLGGSIQEALGIVCIYDQKVLELMRGIRLNLTTLLSESCSEQDLNNMSIGLSHSLSRHKLKFTPDKVDTMIVQAINLLDDLDKELNIYAMRVKEWYGWHFPELSKIINDNLVYSKVVLKVQNRNKVSKDLDLSDTLPEDLAISVKEAIKVSMGTEISEEDIHSVTSLAEEVISLTEYRSKLFEYLKNRMQAIAPNLTHLVGEIVGARLISHAGSLLNLAKQPSSTVQILGAEKALFRALKSKKDTPKYGLIFSASLISQASAKNKGKIARVLAAKCSLSTRVDALGEKEQVSIALASKETVENRLSTLDNNLHRNHSGKSKGQKNTTETNRNKEHVGKMKNDSKQYNDLNDASKKRKRDDQDGPKFKK